MQEAYRVRTPGEEDDGRMEWEELCCEGNVGVQGNHGHRQKDCGFVAETALKRRV